MVNQVQEIESDDEFKNKLRAATGQLILMDFHAKWCGPCKAIAPKVSQLASAYPDVCFMKIDVDECQEVARLYKVNAMPTFIFEKNGRQLDKLTGADHVALENKLAALVAKFSDDNNEASSSSSIAGGYSDLEPHLLEKNCLNEADDHPLKWVFEDNKDLYLESDCDPELLITLTFSQAIKLHSIKVQGPDDGSAPKTVKLFINQPHEMDFDSARGYKAVQEITLTKDEVTEGNVVGLKFVKLQNVSNISLFFPDNQDDEETTKIQRLVLYGKPINTTNMDEFKRVAGKKGESH